MERLTISMSDEFASELGAFTRTNRSEAVRDLARLGSEQPRLDPVLSSHAVATLSYVFSHQTRTMSRCLTQTYHAHNDLHVATMHVHLDHDHCLEVATLRGDADAVRDLHKTVFAEGRARKRPSHPS